MIFDKVPKLWLRNFFVIDGFSFGHLPQRAHVSQIRQGKNSCGFIGKIVIFGGTSYPSTAERQEGWIYTRFIPITVERTMENPPALDEEREALGRKLARYRSLPEYLLDGVGTTLQYLFNAAEAKKPEKIVPK